MRQHCGWGSQHCSSSLPCGLLWLGRRLSLVVAQRCVRLFHRIWLLQDRDRLLRRIPLVCGDRDRNRQCLACTVMLCPCLMRNDRTRLACVMLFGMALNVCACAMRRYYRALHLQQRLCCVCYMASRAWGRRRELVSLPRQRRWWPAPRCSRLGCRAAVCYRRTRHTHLVRQHATSSDVELLLLWLFLVRLLCRSTTVRRQDNGRVMLAVTCGVLHLLTLRQYCCGVSTGTFYSLSLLVRLFLFMETFRVSFMSFMLLHHVRLLERCAWLHPLFPWA